MSHPTDELHMRRALRLAALGREAAPNPMVGCVLLDRDGKKIGEGHHVRPGEPHAEVNALRSASGLVEGGTAYVTLEPCSHHGRTPPCADALIAAGVRRVVIAMLDPDERVSGRGANRLKDAGIEVVIGVCEQDARALNEAYIKHRTTGMPYVTAKSATTLDGKIATASGDSRWITSPITRKWVHRQLRVRNMAIMVGVGTVLADDPELSVRLSHRPAARNPIRIVVDSHLRTPADARVVQLGAADGLTWIAHVDDPNGRAAELEAGGATLIRVSADSEGRVDLRELLVLMGRERSVISILVEGGSNFLAALFKHQLIDRYYVTIAPKIVGGDAAPGPLGGIGVASTMSDALTGHHLTVRRSGPDCVIGCKFEVGV